jgi:hypothetical protein
MLRDSTMPALSKKKLCPLNFFVRNKELNNNLQLHQRFIFENKVYFGTEERWLCDGEFFC